MTLFFFFFLMEGVVERIIIASRPVNLIGQHQHHIDRLHSLISGMRTAGTVVVLLKAMDADTRQSLFLAASLSLLLSCSYPPLAAAKLLHLAHPFAYSPPTLS